MLFALSTTHKAGLAITGGLFIVFALVSSFILPRVNANFPGKGLRYYLVLCGLFFIAMLGAVIYFGRENAALAHEVNSTPATTTPATPGPSVALGDPTKGKAVFASAGCAACHTFTPAGSTGTIGPDLNNLAAYAMKANVPLDQFIEEAITKPPAPYVPPPFPTNVMPTNFGTSLTKAQLADLVAFLAKGP
jgi:cytochrome c551/c552